MKLPSRFAATAGILCLLPIPVTAAPVAGFVTLAPFSMQDPSLPQLVCDNGYNYDGGGSEGEGEGSEGGFFDATGLGFGSGDELMPIPVDCDGGANRDTPGPGNTDVVVTSIEKGISHCGQYTDVWRVDCLSDELERMARRMPRSGEYRQAKAEILAASAKLRALAEQNADPNQPPVRRAAEVNDVRRTTTRPITAVAPSRVVATNLAADAVISELSTTLLRSAGNSASTNRELTRVAQAVDSTKVLLRSA
jgi:hypothetical protein